MPEITITFPRDHRKPSKIAVDGIKGGSCESVTEPFEKALGKVTNREHTPEFYEEPVKEQSKLFARG